MVNGVILIFIGFSLTPIINSNITKINNLNATNLLFNNKYVNGYWKFDDCNGTILSDSSNHEYNGFINGAIWTSNGFSGCALIFDGVNDYVSLDAYSEQIGFNKTDDLIFSVFFKSISNGEGLIYCISDSVLMQNMEFSLGLNSNGNIEFHLWDYSCGIELLSNGIYNDNSWHNCKIFYHGSTAKSIVEIYVDDNLDTSIEKSICSFYDYEFKQAKIGSRAAESSNYFNGLIDEMKIIKYPSGNKQPDKPIIEGSTLGEIGDYLSYNFMLSDKEDDDLYYMIDWGNGDITDWFGPISSGEEINISHQYFENGSYEIKAKAKDYWDEGYWSDPLVVYIGNQAPDIPVINGPAIGLPGIKYNYTFVTSDSEGDMVWYDIIWGDGNTTIDEGPYLSGMEILENHIWSEKGNYMIEARARDSLGSYSDWSQFSVKMNRYKTFDLNLFDRFIERFFISKYSFICSLLWQLFINHLYLGNIYC